MSESLHSPLRRALVLSPCVAALATPWAHAAPAPARKFGDIVGLGVKFSQGQPASDLDQLPDLGVRWVRDVVDWGSIERKAGEYGDFSAPFKQRLAFYKRHGIGLVTLLTLQNDKAYPAQADNPTRRWDADAFGRFAAQVARMLRAEGVRFVLEIGNEPHNSALAKTLGGAWNGKPPSPWVTHYVRMATAAVREVKAFDASIKLLSDDDLWIVHYWYLEAGLPSALDGFAMHPYTPGVPERAAVAHDTDWARPHQLVDADASFTSAVRRLREQGRAKLGHTPEIWLTEWGWPVREGGAGVRGSVPEPIAVAYLPRAFVLAAAAGVEVLCWFSSQDSVDGPMGLTRNGGQRRSTYQAFKTMTAQLGDFSLVRQVAGAQQPTSGLQAYLFNGPQGRKLVAWSADAKPRRLPLPRGARGVDALGQPLADARAAFDAAPVYLSGDWTDAAIDASLTAVE
ncbi:MAG TPA: hypothetical protein VJ598_12210 [Albitalea sp.]|nr:hypothetical protein [Albitalea sp.]